MADRLGLPGWRRGFCQTRSVSYEHMFGVVVDRFETVFDPDDGFDWFELTLAEALVAQIDGWEIDDRAGLLPYPIRVRFRVRWT